MLKVPHRQIRSLQIPLATSGETGGLSWSMGPRALEVGFPSLPGVHGVAEGLPSTQEHRLSTSAHQMCPGDQTTDPA